MHRNTFLVLFVLLLFLTGVQSCNKTDVVDQEKAEELVIGLFKTTESFDNAFKTVNESAQKETELSGFTGEVASNRSCGTVSFEADQVDFFPAVLRIDYGSGCNYEGRDYAGMIMATFDGFLFAVDKSFSIAFDEFSVDDYRLGGNYIMTNKGSNASGQWTTEHSIIDGRLINPQGANVSYGSTVSSAQVSGQDTYWWNAGLEGVLDDVWEEIHTATFVNSLAEVFNITTAEVLTKKISCKWPVSGISIIEGESLDGPLEINFGDGICDNNATVTYSGVTFDVTLN